MEVDPPSGSRLSVVCATGGAEYSSNSSEASSPNSRRNSMNESVIKDESYWERRRKNNDASKRSREKRRLSDLAMEQKIIALSRENERLKTQLESRTDMPMASRASIDFAALPSQSATVEAKAPLLSSALNLPIPSTSAISALPTLLSAGPQLPMIQFAQLQAALQQQYNATRPPCVFSVGSAFTPFQAHKESVIMRAERSSPDSSSDFVSSVIKRVPSPGPSMERAAAQQQLQQQHHHQQQQQPAPQPSLLGQLLAARRTSPTVPQSRTEHHSGLGSPPRMSSSKSDCESISSSASFSPTHSSEEHSDGTAAIRRALSGDNIKSREYMDRRRRNNEAAKRCRANRRAVFEYRSRRVQLLENENESLKDEIGRLKAELEQQKLILSQLHKS